MRADGVSISGEMLPVSIPSIVPHNRASAPFKIMDARLLMMLSRSVVYIVGSAYNVHHILIAPGQESRQRQASLAGKFARLDTLP
jgi:hypothetical protein